MFRCPPWALVLTAGSFESLLALALRDTFAEVARALAPTGHLLVARAHHLAALAHVSCLALACCLGTLAEVARSVTAACHLAA